MSRFELYLAKDESAKKRFLAAVSRGASESEAVAKLGDGFSSGTVRGWMREDKDFARAVNVARRREQRGTVIGSLEDYLPGGRRSLNDPPPPGSSELQIEAEGWRRGRFS